MTKLFVEQPLASPGSAKKNAPNISAYSNVFDCVLLILLLLILLIFQHIQTFLIGCYYLHTPTDSVSLVGGVFVVEIGRKGMQLRKTRCIKLTQSFTVLALTSI